MNYKEMIIKSKKTAIIAESDLIVAADIEDYLITLGYDVYPIITKGEDLIDKVILLNPSIIITDINLNGQLDGIEAIARLEETLSINYIFITAYDDYSRLINSYYLHPVSLIIKPVDSNNLKESLSKVNFELV